MIIIKTSAIQFKNPKTGQPTRAVEEHYNGRRITIDKDGEEKTYRFNKDEMKFEIEEEEMIKLIEKREEVIK